MQASKCCFFSSMFQIWSIVLFLAKQTCSCFLHYTCILDKPLTSKHLRYWFTLCLENKLLEVLFILFSLSWLSVDTPRLAVRYGAAFTQKFSSSIAPHITTFLVHGKQVTCIEFGNSSCLKCVSSFAFQRVKVCGWKLL